MTTKNSADPVSGQGNGTFRPSWQRIFIGRSCDQIIADTEQTKPTLSATSLVGLGLGGVIGAGIFVSVGIAAHDKAGPAVVVSFLIAAVACIAVALCYCECAARVPAAGSSYAYAFAAVGEFGAWLSGWNLATCYFLAGAAVAQGWSGYFQSLLGGFGIHWPERFSSAPIEYNPVAGKLAASGSLINLPAFLILIVIVAIVYRGVKISLRMNSILLAIKLAVITGIVVGGLAHFNRANWIPFAPYGWGGISIRETVASLFGAQRTNSSGALAGAAMVFFAFGGFEMLSAYSTECRNPRTDVPKGVIATVVSIAIIYIMVAIALTGMTRYSDISVVAPISEAFRSVGMDWAQVAVAVGALIGMTSVLLVVTMSLPRVLVGIAQDGLLPAHIFVRSHPRFSTPSRSILLLGTITICVSSLIPLRMVMDFVMTSTLVGYISVCILSMLLRRKQGKATSGYRMAGGPTIPILGSLVCLLLLMSIAPYNWLVLAIWLAIGSAVYFAYGYRRGTARSESP